MKSRPAIAQRRLRVLAHEIAQQSRLVEGRHSLRALVAAQLVKVLWKSDDLSGGGDLLDGPQPRRSDNLAPALSRLTRGRPDDYTLINNQKVINSKCPRLTTRCSGRLPIRPGGQFSSACAGKGSRRLGL